MLSMNLLSQQSGHLPASVERARGHSHSVHGASNFAEMFKGPTPAPLSAPLKSDKWIHFVRHCESEHIVARDAGSPTHYLIQDAVLSSAGERHAETLRRDKALCNEPPELVVASPLRRTMQTAMLAFGSAGTPCVLRAELQETGLTPCDSAQPELGEALLVSHGWLSLLDEYRHLPKDWSIKGSQWRASVGERFSTVLCWIEARPERTIAVVSHHDFLKSSLGLSMSPGEVCSCWLQEGTWWLQGQAKAGALMAPRRLVLRGSAPADQPRMKSSLSSLGLSALTLAARLAGGSSSRRREVGGSPGGSANSSLIA